MRDLLPFCKTETERAQLEAYIEHGSYQKAARSLGVDKSNIGRAISRIKKHAALQGYSPEHDMTRPAPDGFRVKGTSTYYDVDGKVRGQWVKTNADKARQDELLVDALKSAFDDYDGKSAKIKSPRHIEKDMLAVYPMGDPHIGMYAWSDETGEDFDTEIASRDLCSAVNDLVDRSHAAETAVILNLGDYFHSDNMDNRTARSGHALDVDTRWARVVSIGVDTLIACVQSALIKHKRVVVKNVPGNHDDHSAMILTIALSKFFSKEKRVIIDTSPAPFWYHRFGKVLIGSTHGHSVKPANLPGIMAADRHEDWGATEWRYWYTGHIHSKNAEEFPGCMWESFRTLAAKDAWHTASGYRSGRDMQAIMHHKDYGEVARNTCSIAMLRAVR